LPPSCAEVANFGAPRSSTLSAKARLSTKARMPKDFILPRTRETLPVRQFSVLSVFFRIAMKSSSILVLVAGLALQASGAMLRGEQPIFKGKVNNNAQFATSAQDGGKARPPNYRSAWDDCGGVGASATERMRSIASKIKGWAKPLPFVRHAAQDCGSLDMSGTAPGPGKAIVYPGPEIPRTIRDGLSTAAKTLAKYPAAKK